MLSGTYRYLDDLLNLNDGGRFESVYSQIYPPELKLSCTDDGLNSADYLDLTVDIQDNFFVYKLFDKRDSFNFKIINYPDLKDSNIPTSSTYGVYLSQLLSVARNTTDIIEFNLSIERVTKDFLNKCFKKNRLCTMFNKFVEHYQSDWFKLACIPGLPTCLSYLDIGIDTHG